MGEIKYTILESWPALKEDLENLLNSPYKWFASNLENAIPRTTNKGPEELNNLVDILKLFNEIYLPSEEHSH